MMRTRLIAATVAVVIEEGHPRARRVEQVILAWPASLEHTGHAGRRGDVNEAGTIRGGPEERPH